MFLNKILFDINDIVKYFRDNSRLFSFDNTDAESFRNFIIEKAGVYTSYGIGFSRLLELRNSTQKQMGDKFNIVEYNKQILKNGPLPFSILNEAINEYSCGK